MLHCYLGWAALSGPFSLSWRHTQQEHVLSALRLWVMVSLRDGGQEEGTGGVWGSEAGLDYLLFIFLRAEYLSLPNTGTPYLLNSPCISSLVLVLSILVSGVLSTWTQALMSTPCLVWAQPSGLWSFWIPFTASQGIAFFFYSVNFHNFSICIMNCGCLSVTCSVVCLWELGTSLIMQDLPISMCVLGCVMSGTGAYESQPEAIKSP